MADNITIDGKEYPLGSLSEEARSQIVSMQLVDQKIAEGQQQLAIYQTARNAYANALKSKLPTDEVVL
jgi:hypothetical protein